MRTVSRSAWGRALLLWLGGCSLLAGTAAAFAPGAAGQAWRQLLVAASPSHAAAACLASAWGGQGPAPPGCPRLPHLATAGGAIRVLRRSALTVGWLRGEAVVLAAQVVREADESGTSVYRTAYDIRLRWHSGRWTVTEWRQVWGEPW